jgi:hypothetical protein
VAGEDVGTYPITQGTLSAGGNYTITFVSADFTITPETTTTSLVSSANPSVFGSSVTFTATVAPSAATGTVQFYADGVTLGSVPLSGGTASVSTAALTIGTHVITATYSGSLNFAGSTGTLMPDQVVNAACTAVSGLDFDFAPAVPKVGQLVNFMASAVGTAPITYTWNFGHGADVVTTNALTEHIFPLATTINTYTVTLTAANACTSPTAPVSKQVTVWPYLIYKPLILR